MTGEGERTRVRAQRASPHKVALRIYGRSNAGRILRSPAPGLLSPPPGRGCASAKGARGLPATASHTSALAAVCRGIREKIPLSVSLCLSLSLSVSLCLSLSLSFSLCLSLSLSFSLCLSLSLFLSRSLGGISVVVVINDAYACCAVRLAGSGWPHLGQPGPAWPGLARARPGPARLGARPSRWPARWVLPQAGSWTVPRRRPCALLSTSW